MVDDEKNSESSHCVRLNLRDVKKCVNHCDSSVRSFVGESHHSFEGLFIKMLTTHFVITALCSIL